MLFDPDLFSLPAKLRRAHPVICREVEALPAASWIRWPNEADVSGVVRVVPLHLTYRPPALAAPELVELPARAVCAETWSLLQAESVSLVVSRMAPGCHVHPHRDLDGPGHLRCHLGLRLAPGAWMKVDGQRCEWREGECIVFDPRAVHEVANDGDRDRTILIMDFVPSLAEKAELRARGLSLAFAGA